MIHFFILFFISAVSWGSELQTNSTFSADVPKWINKTRIDKVTERVQSFLEWDIRRVTVVWYKDQAAFEKAHGGNSIILALSRRNENIILLGPKVTSENFDQVFGHELVHVISYQKYKDAIPKWLEEGLANYISKLSQVDYKWLQTQNFPNDIHELVHPLNGSTDKIRYNYIASQALAEMIASKCDLKNLLRLSVGRNMESYLDTYCRITNINADYKKWVQSKAKVLK